MRLKPYNSIGGSNWLQGRTLIPNLQSHGKSARGTILDLGCGTSPWREYFPNATNYIRMDIYPYDDDVVVIKTAESLPLPDTSIDVVLLFRMMGDIPDQLKFLKELSRVLKPNGRILIYESITYPQHDLPHDYWRVLPSGLRWAGQNAGLTVEELHYCGGYFAQLAIHLNNFVLGALDKSPILWPITYASRATINSICLVLNLIINRPALSPDYFACLKHTDNP